MNTPNPHSVSPEELMAFCAGELPASRCAEIETALASDAALRGELARLKALDQLLAVSLGRETASGVTQRVAASVRNRVGARSWRVAAAAAGVLLLAGGSWLLWPRAEESPEARSPALADYSVLLPESRSSPLQDTLQEIEWVQASWLPRG